MRKVGFIAIGVLLFLAGATVEASSLDGQAAQTAAATVSYTTDLRAVGTDYQQMFTLCEQKYQAGIAGNMNEAYQIKGQMDVLQAQINQITGKYQTNGN